MSLSHEIVRSSGQAIPPVGKWWDGQFRKQSEALLRNSPPAIQHFDKVAPSTYLCTQHGITPEVGFFDTADGMKLRYAVFRPRREPVFTTLIVPGLNSPIEFHQHLAIKYARLGILAIVYDPRSQGFSSRTAGLQANDVRDFMDNARDLASIINILVAKYQKGELKINAFSMGAVYTLLGLANNLFKVSHSVLVAPAIKMMELPRDTFRAAATATWVCRTRNTIRGYDRIRPSLGWDWSRPKPTKEWLETNIYSRDTAQIRHAWQMAQLEGDMLRPGWPTKRWVAAAFDNYLRLDAMPPKSIPGSISLLLPGDDRMVCSQGAYDFCARTVKNLRGAFVLKNERHSVELASDSVLDTVVRETTQASPRFRWVARPNPAVEKLKL